MKLWIPILLAAAATGGLDLARAGAAPPPAAPAPPDPIGDLEEAQDVDIMTLASIDYRPGKKLPKRVTRLDGLTVRLVGYMSLDTGEGDTSFLLTYDSCGCNGQFVQHFVDVTLTEGSVSYTPAKITVVGVLAVGEETDDLGIVTSIYRLEAETYEE